MYAVSWNKDSYLVLREKKNRKEAEESLQYEILNLIYKNCFGENPNTAVLKNAELKQFVENHPELIVNLKRAMPDIKNERIGTGLYPSIVFLPLIMKKYIAISREMERSGQSYRIEKVTELARKAVAAEEKG